MYVSGSLNSLSNRHLHQVVPASCLWVPCHTWSHTCLDRARWSARRGRLLIHLPQAIHSCISFQHERLPPRHIISWHPLQEPPRGPQDRRGVWENGSSPCRKHHYWDLQGALEAIHSGLHFLGSKRPGAPGPQDPHPRQRFPAVGRHRVPGGVLWNLRAGRSCPVDAATNRCSRQQRHYYGPKWAERKACWCSSTSTPTSISWTESTWTRQATPCFAAGCWGSRHPTPTPGPF